MNKAQPRLGPLRRRTATLPNGIEVLDCGHGYTPDPREGAVVKARVASRRCAHCPYECGEHRAAYCRERGKRRRRPLFTEARP